MTLVSVNSIYDGGKLIAEAFRSDYFTALLSKEALCLKNGHYLSGSSDIKNHIVLSPEDFDVVGEAISHWQQEKDHLWGQRAHGHSWCGYLGTTYYPPHSEDSTYIKKGESKDHLGIGKLEDRLKKGDLEFIIERFRLGIEREGQRALFDAYQIPLISEAFILYDARKAHYERAADIDDCLSLIGNNGVWP
ncbi:MAG: hypothetical protein V1729_02295 [Candidatus Woesearchaeota archaeon]